MSRPAALTLRIYRTLAAAFPHEFKSVYGDELVQAAEDSVEPVWRRHGVAGLLRLLLDIALRVPVEYASEVRRDVLHALRLLAAAPGFTAVVLTSLALGIGVASCAYSEVNGLFRDLPGVRNPDELVALKTPVSYPTYRRYHELRGVFSETFAYVAAVPFGVSLGGKTERTWGHLVTPSYFSTLGVQPRLGRFFDRADETAVVVSHRFWKERFSADPAAVGRTLRINGKPCVIVGVGPEKFVGASPALFAADLWLPVSSSAHIAPELEGGALERRDLPIFQMVGRLRPGVTEPAAEAALTAAARQLAEFYGELDRNARLDPVQLLSGGKVMPLRKQEAPFFKQFLMVMGSLLLVIACANVATMMLARAADRRKEFAVRLALGAGRGRLVRQLLTESVLLAAGAAVPAILFTVWIMGIFSRQRMPFPIPSSVDLTPDWRVLVFTFAVTGLTGILFGLAPALQATRAGLVAGLKEGGTVRFRRFRALSLRNGLMLGQMAASLTLLLMTGYLGIGIQSTLGVQEGFDPSNLYLISLDPVRDGYSVERAREFFPKLLERVKRLPAVNAACLTDSLPASMDGNSGIVFSTSERDEFWARRHMVGRGYFETAGIRILSGRGFRKEDESAGASAVIVTREAVRRVWKGENPVGRRIEVRSAGAAGSFGLWPGSIDNRASVLGAGTRTYEVVGVVRDVSESIIASDKLAAVYLPLSPDDYAHASLRGVTLMVRAAPGVDVIREIRREIAALDPNISSFNARSMTEHIGEFMSVLKSAAWTHGFMGFSGLVLASIGLAGVTAHAVAKRAHEIGIRMALGAQKHHVVGLVMKEGAILATLGTLAGLALAVAGIRSMQTMFFAVASVRGYDPALLAGAPLLLAALALAACYIPARRSARIDPAVTLRVE